MLIIVLESVGLLLAGLLAGEEFIVRWGVHPALSALPDLPHLLARQSLVRRMRVVVPALMMPTVLLAIVVVATSGVGAGFGFRIAGLAALVAFVLFSFLGTVPINIRVNDWNAEAPPSDWKAIVTRWELIDVFRSSAAILGFGLFVVAFAVELSSR